MGNVRISTRLLLGFGVVVALTIVLGLYAVVRQEELQTRTSEIESRDFMALERVQTVERGEDQMRAMRRNVLLAAYLQRDRQPTEAPDVLERRWMQLRDENSKALTELESLVGRWEASALSAVRGSTWRRIRLAIADARNALNATASEAERTFAAVNTGDLAGAMNRTQLVEKLAVDYQAKLADVSRAVHEQIELGREQVQATAEETRRSVILVLVLAVAAGFACAFFIYRSITGPLAEFALIMERVGQGDLRQVPESAGRDEIGDLGRSLARMVAGLKQVAIQTRSAVENLNTATAEILASTQQQAAGTAEQAAAVQQANATMSEISESGAQISTRARQVAASAEAASTASVSGMQSVRNTASIMESIREQAEMLAGNVVELSEKTQAVGEIIQTVNDIAEQSHLLSLNASIQAAIAGEHGRSFTVVANEMKNLAAQSKQATVQVRSILGDIQKGITSSVMLTEEAVKRIESGRQQAGVAESTIRELTDNIEESIRAFQQIVGGSSQQQIGFEQVTQAFRNIGIASQQTATSTKQSEKAAANLSQLAQQLREAIEQYKV